MKDIGFALGLANGLPACEECVTEIQYHFERLGCDYSIDYHPLRKGVEITDNTNGMLCFEFETLGETLAYFETL